MKLPLFSIINGLFSFPIIVNCLTGSFTIFFAILPVWNNEIAKTPYQFLTLFSNFKLMTILISALGVITLLGIILRKYFHAPQYIFWLSYFFSILTLSLAASVLLRNVLKYYQIKRLIVFMDPNTDALGSGWNIIQSKIAIGAGGIFGQGFLHGTQSHYRFLPQQSTDFIFSICLKN